MKTLFGYYLIILGLVFSSNTLYSNSEANSLFNLSFEELMETKVSTGSLIYLSNIDKPVSVTTITSDDIKLTPHRHLLDLLEVYVPGFIFMNHYDVMPMGLRGIISDRNKQFLLLINGRAANDKARSGVASELDNWELDDIDRIEIIRGPGSVTYGPGAISAVINIITKNISTNDGSNARVNYNYPYNSKGISGKFTKLINEDLKIFSYFSIRQTEGYDPEKGYSIMYNTPSFDPRKDGLLYQEYYNDYFNTPQKKFHLQVDFFDNFKFWLRYVNSGGNSNGVEFKSQYQIGLDTNNQPIMGDHKNRQMIKNEHFYATLEHEYQINNNFNLSSMLSWDSENKSRSMGYFWGWNWFDAPDEKIYYELMDHKSIRNKYNNYSESELMLNSILRGDINKDFRIAIGGSLSYNLWGAPWFEDEDQIRMGDKSNIISSSKSTIYGNGLFFGVDSAAAIFVGNGWSTLMYSFFAEAEYSISEKLKLLASGRLDKDSYSEFLFSPRIAAIYKINNNNSLKILAQQSNRMNTAEELLLQHLANNTSSPETLTTMEIIYSAATFEDFFIESSLFYNNIDILSWYDAERSTVNTGNLQVLGFEFELKYSNEYLTVGLNHSLTHLIDWKLSEGINKSGVSYSDYNMEIAGNQVTGYGNNLNNWSNNTTKLFANIKLADNLTFHFNSRLLWGFDGAQDGMVIAEQLVKNTDIESQIYSITDFMRQNGFYDYDLRLNSSINWNIFDKLTLSLNTMNLINLNNNYRYKFEAGNKTIDYLFRMNVISEPLTVGLQINYEF